jgi:hypothetical protein
MEELKQLLHLKEIGSVLEGVYADSFYEIFGFVSWLALIAFLVTLLGRIPPFSRIVAAVSEDMNRPFVESDLILELIPNRRARYAFYRVSMYGLVVVVIASGLSAFYFAGAAILALIANSLTINKFTAFAIFGGLFAFMIFCMSYNLREANKVANFLRLSRA